MGAGEGGSTDNFALIEHKRRPQLEIDNIIITMQAKGQTKEDFVELVLGLWDLLERVQKLE